MKKLLCTILITAAIVLLPHAISAQWITNGPYGGAIYALSTNGTNVYAGTGQNGVYRSTDNGQTWTAPSPGLGMWVNALESTSTELYAGTFSNGVYVSSDHGSTWTARNVGLGHSHIESLKKTSLGVFAGTGNGVYLMANGSTTWTPRKTGMGNWTVKAFLEIGDTIFAGTYQFGLFMTTDGGANWSIVSGTFPYSFGDTYVNDLKSNGDTIYASTQLGIYRSVDRGVTWANTSVGIASGDLINNMAVKGSTVFAGTEESGMYVSVNGGDNWTKVNTGIHDWFVTGSDPYPRIPAVAISGNVVIAGTFDGIYTTTNNGALWVQSNTGILATQHMAITANGNNVISGYGRVYASSNQGATWANAYTSLHATNMQAAVSVGGTAFVAMANQHLYSTSDNGVTWTDVTNGITENIALMASEGTTIMAITAESDVTQKLYYSTDNGQTWTQIIGAYAISGGMSALELRDNYIYIGTKNGVVYRSDNLGVSWLDMGSYLPTVEITTIFSTDEATYVGTAGKGIYKFINDEKMITVHHGIANHHITDIDMENDLLFASTWGAGIYVSANGGLAWFSAESTASMFVNKLASANGKVYAATNAGVYQTDNTALERFMLLAGIDNNTGPVSEKLYPVPARNYINYEIETSGGQATIFGIDGREVKAFALQAQRGQLDINGIPAGMYLVKIQTAAGANVQRILIE